MDYQEIIFNMASKTLEEVDLEGRKHWKVPAVAITEGVHAGTKGAILYLSEDGRKNPSAWDHKPAIVYHPQTNAGPTTACSPEIINNQKIGVPLETKWEDKSLKMNVYLDQERTKEVDDRVANALLRGEKVEVSTGLQCDIEWVKGVHNGEEYVGIARNWRPDHLAILPDQKGACSIEKGAGLLQNVAGVSMSDLQQLVCSALSDAKSKPGYMWNGWLSDVFDGYAIYYQEGDYYQQNYSYKEGKVTLTGSPVKVVRKTVYESVSNRQLVGVSTNQHFTTREYQLMTKKDKVDAILNGNKESFSEADREFLMNQDEKFLDKLVKTKTVEVEVKVEKKVEVPPPVKVENTAPPALSPEDQRVLARAKAREKAEKDGYIENILKNPNNTFTKTYLAEKDVDELEALAKLAKSVPTEEPVENTNGTYMGRRFIAAAGGPDGRRETVYNAEGEGLSADDYDLEEADTK